jgi:SP family arabinose:H+ symporter-like MFS transporter
MGQRSYIFLISLIAALGGLLFGFDIAIFSGTIPFIKPYYQLTDAQLGWTGSSLYIGCISEHCHWFLLIGLDENSPIISAGIL